VALGAGDDRRVDEAERQVGVALDEVLNASQVLLPTVKREVAFPKIAEEGGQRRRGQVRFDQVGKLAERSDGDEVRAAVREGGGADAPVPGIGAR
jgi:hypothetical protein